VLTKNNSSTKSYLDNNTFGHSMTSNFLTATPSAFFHKTNSMDKQFRLQQTQHND